MKISNIALAAVTFMLSSFPDQTHAEDNIELAEEDTAAAHNDLPPTVHPTPEPCSDDPEGWYHILEGHPYFADCESYAQGKTCERYGDYYKGFGKTANEACCACGGGKRGPTVSPSPTVSPTNGPTISPKMCPSGMKLLRVQVVTDAKAYQNRFVVKKKNWLGNFGSKVWDKNNFENRTTKIYQKCLKKDECYKLFMFDEGSDGMCCEQGNGGFKATWRNSVIIDTLDGPKFKDGDVKKVRFGDC